MREQDFGRLEGILQSLKDSTYINLCYNQIMLTVDGRNSTKNRTVIEFDETCAKLDPVTFDFTFYCDDFIIFNKKYSLLIDLSLEEGAGDRYINFENYEWVDTYIPLYIIKEVVQEIPGQELLKIKFPTNQLLVRVCFLREK